MPVAVFIGDEITAAGYRLCGVEVHIADDTNVLQLVQRVSGQAAFVLVGSNVIQGLDVQQLDALLANTDTPVLVVPDVRDQAALPDIAERVHKQLGMLE